MGGKPLNPDFNYDNCYDYNNNPKHKDCIYLNDKQSCDSTARPICERSACPLPRCTALPNDQSRNNSCRSGHTFLISFKGKHLAFCLG